MDLCDKALIRPETITQIIHDSVTTKGKLQLVIPVV